MIKVSRHPLRPIFVNEHGTWAMVFVPLVTGFLRTGTFPFRSLLFVFSAVAAFFAYRPAEMLIAQLRRSISTPGKSGRALVWLSIYLLISGIFALPLLFREGLVLLPVFALFSAIVFLLAQYLTSVWRLSLMRDLLAIIGLTSLAPAQYYVVEKSFQVPMIELWLANFLFFTSSAFYVHLLMCYSGTNNSEAKLAEIRRKRLKNLIYQYSLAGVLALLIATGKITFIFAAAYLPMLVHTTTGAFLLNTENNFRRLGYTFVGYSIFFCILISL